MQGQKRTKKLTETVRDRLMKIACPNCHEFMLQVLLNDVVHCAACSHSWEPPDFEERLRRDKKL